MGRGQEMREALKRGETITAPGAYDAITGRIAQYLGFKYTYMGGYQTGARFALPEALVTMTEFCQVASEILSGARGELSVIMDLGIGFGEPTHMARTIRHLDAIGVAAVHIEDEVGPRRTSLQKPEHTSAIVPIEQYLDRLRYAMQIRKDGDLFIIARTNAYKSTAGGTREMAVERLEAALELGADAVYIDQAKAREDLEYFRKAFPDIPMMALASAQSFTVNEFKELGYNIIVYPGTTIVAAVDAIYRAYKGVKETGKLDFPAETDQEMRLFLRHELCRFPEYWEIEEKTTLQY